MDVDDVYLEQLYTFGDVGRDPGDRIIIVSYMAYKEFFNEDEKRTFIMYKLDDIPLVKS